MILGIDYASVDGNKIDAAATGAKFAYLRASAGLATDPTWSFQRGAWAAAGVPAGPYHALAWHTDPAAQARVALACAGTRGAGELPIALDVEADSAAALHLTPAACLAQLEAVLRELAAHGTVVLYTSARVWQDVLGGAPSALASMCPLWLKVPYAWRARNPSHFDTAPADGAHLGTIPTPWQPSTSAGVWMVQFQGDAIGLPGTTSTVDLNAFVSSSTGINALLHRAGATDVHSFQASRGLAVDGVVGPRTFAALTHP